jgi:hypothetical protein
MTYRGNDLDLRATAARALADTPTAEETAPAAGWRPLAGPRGGPIQIDEALLAACNSAFDAAAFHSAREVRLDHLLYGLTRVDKAATMLEQRGIRPELLRRETATAIAADTDEARSTPRASVEFEDALRRAEARASERRVPASVVDLLGVLLTHGRESAATQLLLRAASDPHALERWRDERENREFYAPPPTPPPAQPPARQARPDVAAILASRLEGLDSAWRALAADVAADRKAIGELLREVQRDLATARSETAHAPVLGLEVEGKLDALGRSLATLGDRFAVFDKLAASDSWSALTARLESVEGKIGSNNSWEIANSLTTTVVERLDQAESGVLRLQEESQRNWNAATERTMALEAMVRAQIERVEEATKTHERDLHEVYEAMVKIGANQQALGNNLNTWRLESSGDLSIISNRLEKLEGNTQELLSRISGEVRALRAEAFDEEARHGRGFKHWLYGTGKVFAPARDDADRPTLRPAPRDETKS